MRRVIGKAVIIGTAVAASVAMASMQKEDQHGSKSRHGSDTHASKRTAYEKEGFLVDMEDGRLWVRKPSQEKSDEHVTLIGAGPGGVTVKAPDRETAIAYLGTVPGFHVEIADGRIWVLKPGQEKTEKHITLIGAGPAGVTIKAVDRDTAREYIEAVSGT